MRVVRIQELFAAGLSSTKIARILARMRDTDGGPSEIATPKLISDLTSERKRIERTILELTNTRAVLDEVISTRHPNTASSSSPQPAEEIRVQVFGPAQ